MRSVSTLWRGSDGAVTEFSAGLETSGSAGANSCGESRPTPVKGLSAAAAAVSAMLVAVSAMFVAVSATFVAVSATDSTVLAMDLAVSAVDLAAAAEELSCSNKGKSGS